MTFEQYDIFCEAINQKKPYDGGWGRGNRPVINVSWYDANAYCKWLSSQTVKKYRLLTEEKWEYAAKGGQAFEYAGSNNAETVAWYSNNSNKKTHLVGGKKANGYGLYDMNGNVNEWTSSKWKAYSGGKANICNNCYVLRSGSWNYDVKFLRIAYRFNSLATLRYTDVGFRIGLGD